MIYLTFESSLIVNHCDLFKLITFHEVLKLTLIKLKPESLENYRVRVMKKQYFKKFIFNLTTALTLVPYFSQKYLKCQFLENRGSICLFKFIHNDLKDISPTL